MALKDILVHVDSSKHNPARLEAAINLAAAHESHLTGLYVLTHAHIPGYIRAQISNEVLEMQAKAAEEAAAKAEANFRDLASKAGLEFEWRQVSGEMIDTLSLHARYSDIIIAGQADPDDGDLNGGADMPDRLILSVGRPVLLVPYVGKYPTMGSRVMVAWDGSRLATRAVNDSMPVLKKAKHVDVMAVNQADADESHGEVPGADICLHLARHGVKAEAHHVSASDVDPADMLLSRAADEGIDMIVMGAYGHARWRELVLGGVTRHMLQHMTVPVLMAH